MTAYSVPFKTGCDQRGCVARATEEVFNTYNHSLGTFCARHAKLRVRELRSKAQRLLGKRGMT